MRVLNFFAKFCGHCPAMEKKLKEHGIEHEDIDVDDLEAVADKYNVNFCPQLLIIDDQDRVIGRYDEDFDPDVVKAIIK